MSDFVPFSERHGLTPPDAPITIRAEAPDWLRKAALECVARDLTGEPNLTFGERLKKNPNAFPQPLGSALEKLWGYTSQYGRHVQEGKQPKYDEAELVVSLAGALSVYLLRKRE